MECGWRRGSFGRAAIASALVTVSLLANGVIAQEDLDDLFPQTDRAEAEAAAEEEPLPPSPSAESAESVEVEPVEIIPLPPPSRSAIPQPRPSVSPQLTVPVVGRSPLPVQEVEQMARTTTVRIFSGRTAGSGVIIARTGQVYTAVTNWHVLGYGTLAVVTPDGRRHKLLGQAVQLGRADLAIVRFRSARTYAIAPISVNPVTAGDSLYAAGFPLYGASGTTLEAGIAGFRLTVGRASLVLERSLVDGYRLGYTNAIQVGMSGGPIFNTQGELVGINGRTAGRDPGFGAYVYQDGTVPPDSLLSVMVASSWGIPIKPNTIP